MFFFLQTVSESGKLNFFQLKMLHLQRKFSEIAAGSQKEKINSFFAHEEGSLSWQVGENNKIRLLNNETL